MARERDLRTASFSKQAIANEIKVGQWPEDWKGIPLFAYPVRSLTPVVPP
jgi:hypothetical protein